MGTVPTGNKQLGKISVAAVTSTSSNIQVETMVGAGILLAPNPPPIVPIKNVGLGAVRVAAITTNITALHSESVVGLAVLQYLPPKSLAAETVTGLGVLRDATVQDTSTTPKNLMLGKVGAAAVISSNQQIDVETLMAFAIVREFHPRKEHTTINIEYGADAEFNTGGN